MSLEELHKFKDSLTGFHSREGLTEFLHHQVISFQAQKGKFALLILDIDHFKPINDKYGHLIGDEALKFFAGLLNEILKGEHFIARYGGDEFIIAMNNKDTKEALELARSIKDLLNKKFFICKDRPILIKTSIGISVFPHDAVKATELLKKADEALYYAKRHGRNKIILASRLRAYKHKLKFLRLANFIVVLAMILTVILFQRNIKRAFKWVDLQGFYSKVIIESNYLYHKIRYKYNYCILELDNGNKFQGRILKEDKNWIYLWLPNTDYKTGIIKVSKKQIRIYLKTLKN